ISQAYLEALPAMRAIARTHRCALDVSLDSDSDLITKVMAALVPSSRENAHIACLKVAADQRLAEELIPTEGQREMFNH
ncbi:hypothetical protein Pmar_PMAR002540, partial [Perkinsus marinus ATCC 50983]